MPELYENKKAIRRHFLDVRKNLSEDEVQLKSESITNQLFQLNVFHKATFVHSYVPITTNKEVETIQFLKKCLTSDKRIAVPKMLGDGKLRHIEIHSLDELQENSWGVPEPNEGKEISVDIFDLIIVPMVAGDLFKNRVGYGKGYYDRFLEKSAATTIGLLFDCQVYEKRLPVEEFDIPLDILITESRQIK